MSARPSLAEAAAALTAPGQLFEMHDVVVGGRPVRTWTSAPPTLRTVLDISLGYGDVDYVVYEGERTTYTDHYRTVATLARRLGNDLGVQSGDRVAIAMRNLPEWVTAWWAIVCCGAVVVPLNAWWTGEELAYGLGDSGAVVCICDTERARRLAPQRAGLPDLRTLVVADEERSGPGAVAGVLGPGDVAYADLVAVVDPDAAPPDVDIQPDDDATIFYTSGTTGKPKGAVGTHRNACAHVMGLAYLQAASRWRDGAEPTGAEPPLRRCHLVSVPLFHATGCHAVMVADTLAGSKLVLMHHFEPARALELVEQEKVTALGGVPTVVMRLLDSPELTVRDVSSVRSVSYGGSPAPTDLVKRVARTFGAASPGNGYGMTETTALTTYIDGADYAAHPGSVGWAVPVADLAVVSTEYIGDEPPSVAPAGSGELWIRGPHVVRGYWDRPDDTARTFTNGWLHTGDLARIADDGLVTIVGRAKDMIIRGGENVYPAEVEDALFAHPAVLDCAVLGTPEPTLGEEVGVVVVLRPGYKIAAHELALYLGRRLARFMVPTRWWFRGRPLPRNAAGKALKRTLRAEVLGEEPDTEWGAAEWGAGEWDASPRDQAWDAAPESSEGPDGPAMPATTHAPDTPVTPDQSSNGASGGSTNGSGPPEPPTAN